MSSIIKINGIYYYKGFNKKFSLRTRNKKEAIQLKKEFDQQFLVEFVTGETHQKGTSIMMKEAIE